MHRLSTFPQQFRATHRARIVNMTGKGPTHARRALAKSPRAGRYPDLAKINHGEAADTGSGWRAIGSRRRRSYSCV
jgi:hypothetical protein